VGGVGKKELFRAAVFPSTVCYRVPVVSLISSIKVVLVIFLLLAQVCRDHNPFMSLTLLTLSLCSVLVAFLIALVFSLLAICSVVWFSSIRSLL